MLKQFFCDNWQEYFKEPAPESFNPVPLTSCREKYGNDLVLLFIEDSKYPNYIFKICRDSQYNFKLEREYLSLQALNTVPETRPFIPTPVYRGEHNGRLFFVQKGLPGISLFKLMKKHGLNYLTQNLIEQCIDLLAKTNSSTKHLCQDFNLPNSINHDVFTECKEEFIKSGVPELQIDKLAEKYISLQDQREKIFSHGDFWPSNIIINEKSKKISGIIDWEFSSVNTSIPTDIIWFLINLAYCIDKRADPNKSIVDALKWAFFEDADHNNLIADFFKQYAAAMSLKILFMDLLKITLAELSMRELSAYGKHTNMDGECMAMLIYAISNEHNLCSAFQ